MYNTAIVTGASSGIGASIARQLATDGTKVFAIARSKRSLDRVAKTLSRSAQKRFTPVVCDVSNRVKLEKVLKSIYAKVRSVDLVISNAGVGYSKGIVDHSWEEVDRVMATNIGGTINLIKLCLELRGKKPLHIVATTSLAGKVGFPDMPVYTASKFAIEGLVESLRYEYVKEDVAFTILRPGITATPFFSKAGMEEFERSVKDLKSFYSPEAVAREFLSKLTRNKKVITVGNDKYFLAILPFIPFSSRFKILDIINKI